ncbi:hypothetical protein MKT60_016810 [Providencia rettgeri]|uniref:hypothetical protein n=1 Tax=Providencia TaxID=586 RepID=UPI001EE7255C|nr:hypothetical protein [Providencia sp. PROV255]MCG5371946.1 hypothetical protein [Providencia rettgeri]MCL0008514.1 hypothetical protein [Providencia rettgeri]
MSNFEHYMNTGKSLEDRKLYRRAAEQYNKAFYIAKPPVNGALSDQQKISSQATDRCLSKAKIKVAESYL